jgi:hypothetical protein
VEGKEGDLLALAGVSEGWVGGKNPEMASSR